VLANKIVRMCSGSVKMEDSRKILRKNKRKRKRTEEGKATVSKQTG
jgi:hypothetical protein